MVCNCKQVKRCAFCKHWYDPTNSAIVPKQPRINLWEIKECKKLCLKKNYEMAATAQCREYESKMEVY